MKNKNFIVALFVSTFNLFLIAQNNALILHNDVVLNITNGAVLNVAQSNQNGIIRSGTANGIIRSEGELNRVAWHINNATGTYVIPFGVTTAAADQLPFTYQITGAGSNPGVLVVSTYQTAANNTPFPTVAPAVTNTNACWPSGSCVNRSLYAVDRYFILRKVNWTTNPTSTITIPYRDVEWAAPNTITEANIQAEYWDGTKWMPGWYLNPPLLGTVNTATNVVSNINAGSGNFYTWILVDRTNPLPVELVSFTVSCPDNKSPLIEWITQSETNNAYFVLQRSLDGSSWEAIATITGAGTSNEPKYYSYRDFDAKGNMFYYSIKQVDFDGIQHDGPVANTTCSAPLSLTANQFNIYGNQHDLVFISFNSQKDENVHVKIFDLLGQIIYQNTFTANPGMNTFRIFLPNLPKSYYMIQATTSDKQEVRKLLLGKNQ
ncbi:MAG: T9SS type A sorting domain-containing protein [Bacteroidales bacterium]|nr:T9SS type A sorting domain-containing protein [Bacteroidales bacterium]